jgi:hypothetical protein
MQLVLMAHEARECLHICLPVPIFEYLYIHVYYNGDESALERQKEPHGWDGGMVG